MKYLGLAYFTPEKFAALAPDDVKALVSQCPALDERMRATGRSQARRSAQLTAARASKR